jgi:hypothetical protein
LEHRGNAEQQEYTGDRRQENSKEKEWWKNGLDAILHNSNTPLLHSLDCHIHSDWIENTLQFMW